MTTVAMNEGYNRAMRKHQRCLNGASSKGVGFARDSVALDWKLASMICEKAEPILKEGRRVMCFCDGARVAVTEVTEKNSKKDLQYCIGTIDPESGESMRFNTSYAEFWREAYERLVQEIVSRRVMAEHYRFGEREFNFSVSAIAHCVDNRGAFSVGELRRRKNK